MEYPIVARSISIIIPTFNGVARIGKCLDALLPQAERHRAEILVVNDGSSDATTELVRRYPKVRLINQSNAGPAVARNRGAFAASGEIILFTDDDCVPSPGWLQAMLEPFEDEQVIATKGAYLTRQTSVVARFVQLEYEDRYRRMRTFRDIDFVDTYSAAFRRSNFLEMGGYDASFPLACAEDAELSYRMSSRGWKMRFVPDAVVYHTHPATLSAYFRKKYKFAFWRMLAVRKNPEKAVRDSHTPQLMKFQLLFGPAMLGALGFDLIVSARVPLSFLVLAGFLISTLPFTLRALANDTEVGLLSPALLAARASAQVLGVAAGLFHANRKPAQVTRNSAA